MLGLPREVTIQTKSADGRYIESVGIIDNLDAPMVARDGETLCCEVYRLATSPACRRRLGVWHCKGVGESLVGIAVLVSHLKDFNGRLRLTALNEAVDFYESMGFERVGMSDTNGQPLLELSEENALPLLAKFGI